MPCTTSLDTIPPGPVTNLTNTTYLNDRITWTWTNPTDADFSKMMVYLDGAFVTNTSNATYTATGLAAGTSHTITLKTMDTSGNVGSGTSHASTTAPALPQPPSTWTCSGTLTDTLETMLAADASAHNSGPDFRRSDSRIAYAHGNWPGMEIWNMGSDGSSKTRLTTKSTHGDSYEPAWSPDGTRIAYGSNLVNGGFDIWTMNADGSGKVDLASNSATARWSPDGTKILYDYKYSPSGSERDLYVMSADGSNKTALVSWPGSLEFPGDWSPDGQRVVFYSNKDGATHIYRINSDGTGLLQMTSGCANDTRPRYSPDGKKIGFTSDRAGGNDLWVMDPDGTNMTRLTTSTAPEWMGSWSPSGQSIAYQRDDASGWADVYRLDLGCAAGAPGPFTPVCQAPLPDTTPPGPVANLVNATYLSDRITWTWTNPTDADFGKVMVYVDGVFVANTTTATYTATGLAASTRHTLTLKAVDTSNNVGSAVSHTATTAPAPVLTTLVYIARMTGSVGGTITTLGTACTPVDWSQFNAFRVTRDPAGGMVVSINAQPVLSVGDNTVQSSTYFQVQIGQGDDLDDFAVRDSSGGLAWSDDFQDRVSSTGFKQWTPLTPKGGSVWIALGANNYLTGLTDPAYTIGAARPSSTAYGSWEGKFRSTTAAKSVAVTFVASSPVVNFAEQTQTGYMAAIEARACAVTPPPSGASGWLVATSAPTGASVYADGTYVGQTPATSGTSVNVTLAAGKHNVTMTKAGFNDCVQTVDVVADRANPVHCNFNVKVTPQVSGSDLVLSWPAFTSSSYYIHKTSNKFGWDLTNYTTASGTSATLSGEAAGSGTEYYLVRTVDPVLGELNSQLAFKTSKPFTFQPGKTNLHWVSVPYGGSAFKKASDIVAALEPDGANSKVSMVAKWNSATQSTVGYGYVPGVGWMGTDFSIAPGDGIYLYLSGNSGSFSWSITDAEQNTSRSFTFQPGKTNLHWVSVPFAGKYAKASDIVASLEPDGANSKVSMVAKWNSATQSTVGYGYVPGVGWMGTDFSIAPGDGIYLYLSGNSGSFEWTPGLAVP